MMVVVVALLAGMTGFAAADSGVTATPETIGISTVTVVQVTGHIISRTDLSMTQSSTASISDVPPLESGAYYQATYNEDTISNGVGVIEYTKTMDVDTGNMNVNQYNIEATKLVSFLGDGTSSLMTSENIWIDGTAVPQSTRDALICTLGSANSAMVPAFCNSAEAGSSVFMQAGSVTTSTSGRFIMQSGDPGVELNHNIRVINTIGKASAYIEVLSQEARGDDLAPYAVTRFKETTTVDGLITLFDKEMRYNSAMKR
ncbi:MAG: hypothetical protein WC382_01150 [Methanoregulaceae archaeon]|jgi:hypothetical protein